MELKTGRKRSNKWLFDVGQPPTPQANELNIGRVKTFLYESIHRSITRHNLHECFQLLNLLPKETTLDPYILFRFVMILIESNPSSRVNKNVIIHLESLLSKLDLRKPDIFVQILSYFLRNNRIEDAKELFEHRKRFMALQIHQSPPATDVNLKCYEFLLNYIEWDKKLSTDSLKLNFDVSMQGWLVNVIDCLKSSSGNYEFFVLCLIRVLLYYGYSKKLMCSQVSFSTIIKTTFLLNCCTTKS